MLVCSRIRFLCAIVYEIYGEVIHIKIPKESLILLVFRDREVHKHYELFLILSKQRHISSCLSGSQRQLEPGSQCVNQLIIVRSLISAIFGKLVKYFSDTRLGLSALLVALVHKHFWLTLVYPQLSSEDLYFVQNIYRFLVLQDLYVGKAL